MTSKETSVTTKGRDIEMSPESLILWRKRMQLSQEKAAELLVAGRRTYQMWRTARAASHTTSDWRASALSWTGTGSTWTQSKDAVAVVTRAREKRASPMRRTLMRGFTP